MPINLVNVTLPDTIAKYVLTLIEARMLPRRLLKSYQDELTRVSLAVVEYDWYLRIEYLVLPSYELVLPSYEEVASVNLRKYHGTEEVIEILTKEMRKYFGT